MIKEIRKKVQDSIAVKQNFSDDLYRRIVEVSQLAINAYKKKHKVVFMGNGGSAADAQHLAAELVGRCAKERTALPSLALNANSSSLTAISNDYSYNQSFARQIEAFVKKGDVVIGITTSGNSENVIEALKQAKLLGAVTVALTGETGGRTRPVADVLLNVPSRNVARIQESHILIGHIICELIEATIFP